MTATLSFCLQRSCKVSVTLWLRRLQCLVKRCVFIDLRYAVCVLILLWSQTKKLHSVDQISGICLRPTYTEKLAADKHDCFIAPRSCHAERRITRRNKTNKGLRLATPLCRLAFGSESNIKWIIATVRNFLPFTEPSAENLQMGGLTFWIFDKIQGFIFQFGGLELFEGVYAHQSPPWRRGRLFRTQLTGTKMCKTYRRPSIKTDTKVSTEISIPCLVGADFSVSYVVENKTILKYAGFSVKLTSPSAVHQPKTMHWICSGVTTKAKNLTWGGPAQANIQKKLRNDSESGCPYKKTKNIKISSQHANKNPLKTKKSYTPKYKLSPILIFTLIVPGERLPPLPLVSCATANVL